MYEAQCRGCQAIGWTMMSVDMPPIIKEAEKHLEKNTNCKWISVWKQDDNAAAFSPWRPYARLSRSIGGGLLQLPLVGEKKP